MSNKAKERAERKYDERQMYEQCRGYFFGFWGLILYLVFIMLLEAGFGIEPLSTTDKCYLGTCIGFTAYIVYCVFKDAYFPLGGSKTTLLVINASIIGVLIMEISGLADESFDIQFTLLTWLVMTSIIDICIFVHHRKEKKRANEDK